MSATRPEPASTAEHIDSLKRECERLRAENQRLAALLREHGFQVPASDLHLPNSRGQQAAAAGASGKELSVGQKVRLFRSLFRGRTDVYSLRWDSRGGRSGYSPACGNEWRPGVCRKPRVKCSDCDHRLLLPLTD